MRPTHPQTTATLAKDAKYSAHEQDCNKQPMLKQVIRIEWAQTEVADKERSGMRECELGSKIEQANWETTIDSNNFNLYKLQNYKAAGRDQKRRAEQNALVHTTSSQAKLSWLIG